MYMRIGDLERVSVSVSVSLSRSLSLSLSSLDKYVCMYACMHMYVQHVYIIQVGTTYTRACR